MGTRADFYVNQSSWLGSIGFDGYPDGINDVIFEATSEESFRSEVHDFLKNRQDATFPEDNWPWPWTDSKTTDFAYSFDTKTGKVLVLLSEGWTVLKNIDWDKYDDDYDYKYEIVYPP